jgi:hypothetical protein
MFVIFLSLPTPDYLITKKNQEGKKKNKRELGRP